MSGLESAHSPNELPGQGRTLEYRITGRMTKTVGREAGALDRFSQAVLVTEVGVFLRSGARG